MTNIESQPAASVEAGLIAPWWHTALLVLLIIGLSFAGARQLRTLGDKPLHLVANYSLSIAYEWILVALVLWGIHLRKVPLRQLLGERKAGGQAWLADIGAALVYWVVALSLLAVLGNVLVKLPGSHIDPQKIGVVTQKLAPGTPLEMLLFLMLSVSAGFCEELIFRGYLQQQVRSNRTQTMGRCFTFRVGVWGRARL
jgi:membrane protease YdiL (CAAX protease family)